MFYSINSMMGKCLKTTARRNCWVNTAAKLEVLVPIIPKHQPNFSKSPSVSGWWHVGLRQQVEQQHHSHSDIAPGLVH